MAKSSRECERLLYPLVRYFHDCLAAQCEWARSVNVIEQKDVTLLALTAHAQERLGTDGRLELRGVKAAELAKRAASGGAEVALSLGALFLVGQMPRPDEGAARRYCAPLLEVPMRLKQLAGGRIVVEPEEIEFSVNYSLVSELLGGDSDDLDDRLADLSELVPDFPIDATEFDTFWNGFRTIAPEVPLSPGLPPRQKPPRRDRSPRTRTAADKEAEAADSSAAPRRLDIVDFFVPELPGAGVFHLLPATALILGRRSGLPMSALSELAAMDGMPLHKTALAPVLDPASARPPRRSRTARAIPDDAHPLPLTPAQEAIVRSARTSPLTVVTGPPGTGKSYTITAIVLDALLNGQTVLVASQMDKAVEVVAEMVERFAGPYAMARSGGRAAQRELADIISQMTGPLRKLEEVAASAIRACSRRHGDLTAQLRSLEQGFRKTVQLEQVWSESRQQREHLEPICTLPVLDLDGARVRRAVKAVQLARRVAVDAGWLPGVWRRWQVSRARRLLNVPADWDCCFEELDQLARVESLRLAMGEAERRLKPPFPADAIWAELADVERRRSEAALELLRLSREKRLDELIAPRRQRAVLRDVATLLRRRKRELKIGLQQRIPPAVLLRAFPAWACTSRTLCEILPASAGLFDVVVIDEASQCDAALASVALVRAKRAVVVGDPHQLRHVCFLSHAREQAALAKHGVPLEVQERFRYRRSLFDIAADAVDQRSLFFLSEHFRSHPQIIGFSNRQFYDQALCLMTSRPARDLAPAIEVRQISGRRDERSSVNRKEVAAALEIVESIAEAASGDDPPSIGIVSPFRDQADAVRERLIEALPARVLERHAIVAGTAHALQGDEKDVVILSTSIDADSHPASLRFLETPNLFNVAITRARRKLIVLASVAVDDLPAGLLREFLAYASGPWTPHLPTDESGSEFERQIVERLRERGVELWPGFVAAGRRINVVAGGAEGQVAVLCDEAARDAGQPVDPLLAQRRLARAGWRVRRIPDRTWRSDWYACCEQILQK